MAQRVCLDCGSPLHGRSDKKFCSDQCRNNYNNRLNRDANNYIRNVHNILRRNRRILSDLYMGEDIRIYRHTLESLGFSFSFHTHTVQSNKGNTILYCFEYGYAEEEDGQLRLHLNENYLKQNNF